MTFEQLEFFAAAADSETFFDAAETVHTTQSTISKQIKKLEQELGVSLFDRTHRMAELTPAGIAFFEEAQALLDRYRQTMKRMEAFRETGGHQIHIGCLPVASQYGLTKKIKEFRERFSDEEIQVTETEEPDLLRGLNCGKYDMIIGRQELLHHLTAQEREHAPKEKYFFEKFTEDSLVVLLPISHPAAGKKRISPAELKGEKLYLMQPHTSVYRVSLQLLEHAGILPVIAGTPRMESIISAVACEEGVGLLPAAGVKLFCHDKVAVIPLMEGDAPELSVGVIWKEGNARLRHIFSVCTEGMPKVKTPVKAAVKTADKNKNLQ